MTRSVSVAIVLAVLLSGCGSSGGDTPGTGSGNDGISDGTSQSPAVGSVARVDVRTKDQLYAYRPDSPYAGVLKDCALIDDAADACPLATLPFITQATADFTRDDIMDRLLVTHDWMGERFEAVLNDAPESMIPLFGSLTSIAIGSTVRPSNYWSATGGIQLDPDNLWLSVVEKANVSIAEDYRSNYGRDLSFWAFGTLRSGNQPALRYYSLTDESERMFTDIRLPMYRLLYHELAHAVDYLPTASVPTLDMSLTPAEALFVNEQYFLSPQLQLDLPLYSSTLYELGQVSFQGEAASEFQINLSPADVGVEMAGDGAVKYYAYSSWREDFATLFAMAMMKTEFNTDYYIAFVDKPVDEENYACSELLVGWGMKNRLSDSLVRIRAQWVMESIYGPSGSIDAFFLGIIGQAQPMLSGIDWCTNRDGATVSSSMVQPRARVDDATQANRQLLTAADKLQLLGERRVFSH